MVELEDASSGGDDSELRQRRERTERLDADARRFWNFPKFVVFVLAIAVLKALLRKLAHALSDFDPSAHRAAISVMGMGATALLLAITLRGAARRKLSAKDTATPRALSRFGGWLTVFQASVVLGIVAFWSDVLRAMFSRSSGSSSSSVGQLVTVSVAALPTLVFLYGLVLIVQRRPVATTFWKALLSAATVLFTAGSLSPEISIEERERLLDAVSWAVIWLVYWQRSHRVRSTFAKSDIAATKRPAALTDPELERIRQKAKLGEGLTDKDRTYIRSRSGAARAAEPRGPDVGDGAKALSLKGWIDLKGWISKQPRYAWVGVLLACGLAWFTLALWPPSLAGSWYDRTDPGFSVTLTQTGGRISGTGNAYGNGFSVAGTASTGTADLEVKFAGDETGFAETATMPDRNTVILILSPTANLGDIFAARYWARWYEIERTHGREAARADRDRRIQAGELSAEEVRAFMAYDPGPAKGRTLKRR